MTALQFGVAISPYLEEGADPVRDSQLAEELGFDFLSTSDHPCGTDPSYEVWTMLSYIAAVTSRITIATRVLGLPFRAPAMVAKMAETLHRMSGRRFILGLGGGSGDDEFKAFGLMTPSPKDKVDGLEELITIIHGLWSTPSFTYRGRLFHTDGADIEPKPEHRIPIWLGTYGPRALNLTGRLADGWIPSYGYAPPEQVAGMRDRIVAAAREAGRDPSEITCAYQVMVDLDGEHAEDSSVVSGSPDAIAARLVELTKLGFTAFSLAPTGADVPAQLRVLAAEVIPAVRAQA